MNVIPPKIKHTKSRLPSAFLIGVILVIAGLIYLFDPTKNSFYPECQFHRLTGLNCPSCGATRAIFALLHWKIIAALHDNALFVITIILMIFRAIYLFCVANRIEIMQKFVSVNAFRWFAIVAVIFTVLRNLPALSFLSP